MSRDCRECGNCGACGNCGNCGGCNGHNHDDRCEFIACERQLRAAKEAIREAEEILEGKYCGGEHDGHKGGHDCGCRDLRKCEFELRIANNKILKSAAVLNGYIDEYIKDDCDCCECECCCTSCCCPFDTCCSNYYDNPNKYDRETGCKDKCNCGCKCGWGR